MVFASRFAACCARKRACFSALRRFFASRFACASTFATTAFRHAVTCCLVCLVCFFATAISRWAFSRALLRAAGPFRSCFKCAGRSAVVLVMSSMHNTLSKRNLSSTPVFARLLRQSVKKPAGPTVAGNAVKYLPVRSPLQPEAPQCQSRSHKCARMGNTYRWVDHTTHCAWC